jgi:hypothetical protein
VKLVAAVGAVVVSVAHNPLNILGGMAPAVESGCLSFSVFNQLQQPYGDLRKCQSS